MLLPPGAIVILLCMRNHQSSFGCYMQLLALRYTNAPVHTLRVGEAAHHGNAARTKNNVQAHVKWTARSVTHTLQAIALLSQLRTGRDGGQSRAPPEAQEHRMWPALPSRAARCTLPILDGGAALPPLGPSDVRALSGSTPRPASFTS